jgi:hypothetical protein
MVIETEHGFYCIVKGRRFGAWRSRAEAVLGLQIEERRAAEKDARLTIADDRLPGTAAEQRWEDA